MSRTGGLMEMAEVEANGEAMHQETDSVSEATSLISEKNAGDEETPERQSSATVFSLPLPPLAKKIISKQFSKDASDTSSIKSETKSKKEKVQPTARIRKKQKRH